MLLHNPTTVGGKTEARSNGRKLNQFSDEHLLPNRIPIQSERLLRSLCESLLQRTGNRTFSNHRRKDHSGTSSESEVVTTGKNCGSHSTGSAANLRHCYASECLRNYLDGDGSQIADMVVDSGLKLRQDDTQLSLSLGGSNLCAQLTNVVF